MKHEIAQLLAEASALGCPFQLDEALAEHTTFKVGGPCAAMIRVVSEESGARLFAMARGLKIPCFVIGKGSNLLCDDRGFDGVVLKIGIDFSGVRLVGDGLIEADAGCFLTKLCIFAAEHSLTGLEWAYGIPGNVGGAVYMNAGAYTGEIKDVIKRVRFASADGSLHEIEREQMALSYRSSIFSHSDTMITKAIFQLKPGEQDEIKAQMDNYMKLRNDKQPLEFPSAGSTFKRPPGQFAGKLIQDCGLKGLSVGGAQVSEKHSGFVINRGTATSEEISALIKTVQDTVLEKTGYYLACEVKKLPFVLE
ncbi:MAG: UDP-N-acetylmuramate dehydrogenase [Oscillospiraceae bacterium]